MEQRMQWHSTALATQYQSAAEACQTVGASRVCKIASTCVHNKGHFDPRRC